jgi:hypothetical protein
MLTDENVRGRFDPEKGILDMEYMGSSSESGKVLTFKR